MQKKEAMGNKEKAKNRKSLVIMIVYIAIFTIKYFYPESGWGNTLAGIAVTFLWIKNIWEGGTLSVSLHSMMKEYGMLARCAHLYHHQNSKIGLRSILYEFKEFKNKFSSKTSFINFVMNGILFTLIFLVGYTITAIVLIIIWLLKFVVKPLILKYLIHSLAWIKTESENKTRNN
ncbi:MAG: hypothetical protein LBU27_09485 [Candidatus Peribacteria bacterium]|jgi:hypothetical protein|nr:hypothetical protein [Candidatus Peribacteria bacterium]